jgi:hypothetical protein
LASLFSNFKKVEKTEKTFSQRAGGGVSLIISRPPALPLPCPEALRRAASISFQLN